MTGYEFCLWLQGVLEMNPDGLRKEQIAKITEKMEKVKSPEQFAMEMEDAQPKPTRPSGGSGATLVRC
jgi:hypothetical protein